MKIIPHNKPTLEREEEEAAVRVIRSGWVAQAAEVDAFENSFCQYLGLPDGHAVALSSGTAALYLALWALDAGKKKVAYPVYACAALRNAVYMVGGEHVPLDIASGSPNIDLNALKKCGSDVAIVPHMFGIPVDIAGLKGIEVIEDCAQSLGAEVRGTKVGLHGRLGIYSFYATKLMTSGGQGGMLVSTDNALVDAVRDYRRFDQRRDKKKRFNFQMTDLQAAIGHEQLRKLPYFLERRSEIFDIYKSAGLKVLDIGGTEDDGHLVPVRYRSVMLTDSPGKIIDLLDGSGIKAIIPIEDWELLDHSDAFSSALKLTRNTVSLPTYPLLSNEDADRILDALVRS